MADPKSNKVLVTKAGLKKLEEELQHLSTVARKEVSSRLAEAISYGDLSENSEAENCQYVLTNVGSY